MARSSDEQKEEQQDEGASATLDERLQSTAMSLYPFAIRLTGEAAIAEKILRASFSAVSHELNSLQSVDQESMKRRLRARLISAAKAALGNRRPQHPAELRVLSFEQRVALVLIHVETFSLPEAAEILKMMPATVERLANQATTAIVYGGETDPAAFVGRWRDATETLQLPSLLTAVLADPVSNPSLTAVSDHSSGAPTPSHFQKREAIVISSASWRLPAAKSAAPGWKRSIFVAAIALFAVAIAGHIYWDADFARDETAALPESETKLEAVVAPEPEAKLEAVVAPEPETKLEALVAAEPASRIDAGPRDPASDLPLTLSNADILSVIRAHEDELYTCASEHREQHPGATGTLRIRWRINLDGTTTENVVLTPELETSAFAKCMAKEIGRWKFPPHRESRDPIDFPFRY